MHALWGPPSVWARSRRDAAFGHPGVSVSLKKNRDYVVRYDFQIVTESMIIRYDFQIVTESMIITFPCNCSIALKCLGIKSVFFIFIDLVPVHKIVLTR